MQKTRFEIEQKLRRERRAKKKKAREQAEREQNRVIRASRRSRLEDTSKSKAMDELKAKRSAGEWCLSLRVEIITANLGVIQTLTFFLWYLQLYLTSKCYYMTLKFDWLYNTLNK